MSEAQDNGKDRRVYPRVEIPHMAQAVTEDDFVNGAVADISAGGVAIRTVEVLEIGQEVNLEIEGMSTVRGHVMRTLENGFVVSLDLDDDERDQFLAEVMQIQNNIDPNAE
ncbi:MAG: PilZ domain-containing protein [Rhodospirillales bacterium]|nr:PilZ domain-containing protein [Rhodospirillales bacterium]